MKYVSKLIKFTQLSEVLGKHRTSIKHKTFPKKYKRHLRNLDEYLKNWVERQLKENEK